MLSRLVPILLLAVSASAYAQESYLLTARVKEGSSQNYKVSAEIKFGEDKVTMLGKVLNKIDKVEKDRISMSQKLTIEKIQFGDEKMEVEETMEYATVVSPRGDLLELRGADIEESDIRESSVGTVLVPETSVKIGEKWNFEVKEKSKWHPVPISVQYEAIAIETIAGIKSMKVKFSGKETEGSKPLEVSGEIWISIEDGMMTKLIQTTKNATIDEGITGDTTETIERIAA